jgi:hypothetical protein
MNEQTNMKAYIKNCDDENVEVKVGDSVWFKSDFEQRGTIIAIKKGQWSDNMILVLHNPNGFGGEYLRYATETEESTDRCWI